MNILRKLCFSVCYTLLLAVTCQAENVSSLEQVQEQAQKTLRFEAEFQQKKLIPFMDIPLESSGKLCFDITHQNTPRIFWEYRIPEKSGFSCLNQSISLWSQDGKAIDASQERFLKNMIEEMLSWMSFDKSSLLSRYDISRSPHDPCRLTLIPLKNNPFLSKAEILFAQDYSCLKEIHFWGSQQDETILTFINSRVNEPLSDDCNP